MISIGETRSTSYSCVFHGSLSGPHLLELRKTLGERYGLNYTKLLYKCLRLSRMPKHRNKGQKDVLTNAGGEQLRQKQPVYGQMPMLQ